jgi:hypothetical protein
MSLADRIQYPKFITLAFSFLLAYLLFQQGAFTPFLGLIGIPAYTSAFLAGLFFSFGFTSGFAIAVFVEIAPSVNPFFAALLAGLGATIADVTLFELIKVSFDDEWAKVKESRPYLWLRAHFHRHAPWESVRNAIKWFFACIIIASPLPDEIGITLMAGLAPHIGERRFALLCFSLNTIGVYIVISAARAAL